MMLTPPPPTHHPDNISDKNGRQQDDREGFSYKIETEEDDIFTSGCTQNTGYHKNVPNVVQRGAFRFGR